MKGRVASIITSETHQLEAEPECPAAPSAASTQAQAGTGSQVQVQVHLNFKQGEPLLLPPQHPCTHASHRLLSQAACTLLPPPPLLIIIMSVRTAGRRRRLPAKAARSNGKHVPRNGQGFPGRLRYQVLSNGHSTSPLDAALSMLSASSSSSSSSSSNCHDTDAPGRHLGRRREARTLKADQTSHSPLSASQESQLRL
eukprot:447255-Rhodomonas_salina.1